MREPILDIYRGHSARGSNLTVCPPSPHPGNYSISVTINMHFGIHAYKLACMSARFASVHVRMFKLSIHAGKHVSIVCIFACKMNDIFTAHPV
jgi:hypothetical protein